MTQQESEIPDVVIPIPSKEFHNMKFCTYCNPDTTTEEQRYYKWKKVK